MKAERTLSKGAWATALTTLATALVFNACCWLPPVLIALTGTGAGYLAFLEPWKPYLLAFTAVQLTIGLMMAYRKPKHNHRHRGEACAQNHELSRKVNIRVMWGVVVVVICLNVWDFTKDHAGKGAPAPVSHVAVR